MAVIGISRSLSDLGHHIRVIVCGQSIQDTNYNLKLFEKLANSGVNVEIFKRLSGSKYGTLLKFNELKTTWNKIKASDFVVLHQVFQLQYIAIFPILILLNKPYVAMPHGSLTSYQRKQHVIRKAFFYPATYLLLNCARAIFVATEMEKRQLPKYLIEKGIIVGLGIETQGRKSRNTEHSTGKFNLLFMGRLVKKKRLDIALRAFSLASISSEYRMKFIVCGSGEDSEVERLTHLVEDLHLESYVEFRGWVDSTEKELAFLESDCFILTSEDENFAIAAAEALAYGVPCILTSNVALASLVEKFGAGIVLTGLIPLEIEQSINKIASSDKEVLKTASIQAAAEISWERVSRQWESAIKSLVSIR